MLTVSGYIPIKPNCVRSGLRSLRESSIQNSTVLCLRSTGCADAMQESRIQSFTQFSASLEKTCLHGGNGGAQNASRFFNSSFLHVAEQDRGSNLGPRRSIASVKWSVRSRRQQNSSGLGFATNASELVFISSSGLPGKTSKTPRLRRSNAKASFRTMRVSQVESAIFPQSRRDEGRPSENFPVPHPRRPPGFSLSVGQPRGLVPVAKHQFVESLRLSALCGSDQRAVRVFACAY